MMRNSCNMPTLEVLIAGFSWPGLRVVDVAWACCKGSIFWRIRTFLLRGRRAGLCGLNRTLRLDSCPFFRGWRNTWISVVNLTKPFRHGDFQGLPSFLEDRLVRARFLGLQLPCSLNNILHWSRDFQVCSVPFWKVCMRALFSALLVSFLGGVSRKSLVLELWRELPSAPLNMSLYGDLVTSTSYVPVYSLWWPHDIPCVDFFWARSKISCRGLVRRWKLSLASLLNI